MSHLQKIFGTIYSVIGFIAVATLFCGVLCLLVIFYFGAPIAVIAETTDLLMMDSQTVGVVTDVDIRHGNRGVSATDVTYQFSVGGRLIESHRMYPGFLGNGGGFAGGARLAEDFAVGKKCDVFYDASSPERCSLQFGWFQWSVGFSLGVWGMTLGKIFVADKSPYQIVAFAFLNYGGGLIFVGPFTVRVYELHLHLAALICIMAAVAIRSVFKQRREEQSEPSDEKLDAVKIKSSASLQV